jgi:hypothetical protein
MMRGLSLTNQLFKYQRAHSATQAVKPSLPCPSGHSNQRETIHQGRLLTSIIVTITIVIIVVTRILQSTFEMARHRRAWRRLNPADGLTKLLSGSEFYVSYEQMMNDPIVEASSQDMDRT